MGETLRTVGLWLGIWILPLLAIAFLFGPSHVLAKIGWYFSYLAMFTFGGAYAVLAWMAQDAVEVYRWLAPGEMVDGLGLAETTPGPLILVTQFVGFLAAFREGGGNPWAMGVLGAAVTLWATFAPCFLWIFAGARYVERLHAEPRLKSALAAVTAAVVGVILNLTVWFALHVLFATVNQHTAGPLRFVLPEVQSVSWAGGHAFGPCVRADVPSASGRHSDAGGMCGPGAGVAIGGVRRTGPCRRVWRAAKGTGPARGRRWKVAARNARVARTQGSAGRTAAGSGSYSISPTRRGRPATRPASGRWATC